MPVHFSSKSSPPPFRESRTISGTRSVSSLSLDKVETLSSPQIKQGLKSPPLSTTTMDLDSSLSKLSSVLQSPRSQILATQRHLEAPVRPYTQRAVMTLGSDSTVLDSARSLLRKSGHTPFDPEQLPGANDKLTLIAHGSSDGSQFGNMTPQQLAKHLKSQGITKLHTLSLKGCNSAAFAQKLFSALGDEGIQVQRITGRTGDVALVSDGHTLVKQDGQLLHKVEGSKIEVTALGVKPLYQDHSVELVQPKSVGLLKLGHSGLLGLMDGIQEDSVPQDLVGDLSDISGGYQQALEEHDVGTLFDRTMAAFSLLVPTTPKLAFQILENGIQDLANLPENKGLQAAVDLTRKGLQLAFKSESPERALKLLQSVIEKVPDGDRVFEAGILACVDVASKLGQYHTALQSLALLKGDSYSDLVCGRAMEIHGLAEQKPDLNAVLAALTLVQARDSNQSGVKEALVAPLQDCFRWALQTGQLPEAQAAFDLLQKVDPEFKNIPVMAKDLQLLSEPVGLEDLKGDFKLDHKEPEEDKTQSVSGLPTLGPVLGDSSLTIASPEAALELCQNLLKTCEGFDGDNVQINSNLDQGKITSSKSAIVKRDGKEILRLDFVPKEGGVQIKLKGRLELQSTESGLKLVEKTDHPNISNFTLQCVLPLPKLVGGKELGEYLDELRDLATIRAKDLKNPKSIHYNNKPGAMASSLVDTLTGDVFFGTNVDQLPGDLHPLLQERLLMYQDYLSTYPEILTAKAKNHDGTQQISLKGWFQHAGLPGTHSEVMALNQALKNREKLKLPVTPRDLDDFAMFHVAIKSETPTGCCVNCSHLVGMGTHSLSGVKGFQKPYVTADDEPLDIPTFEEFVKSKYPEQTAYAFD